MSIFNSISKYALGKRSDDDAYSELRDVAVEAQAASYLTEEVVSAFLRDADVGEAEFMTVNYGDVPEAVHQRGARKGAWKYRSYLPRSYSTAKSALKKGLEAGQDVTDIGKTELEKKTRAATVQHKSPTELVADAIATLFKRVDKLEGVEKADALLHIRVQCDAR